MDEGITPFGDQGWREPMMMDDGALRRSECGAPVTSITRGRQPRPDGTLGPAEPARFGCGHLAGKTGALVQMDLASMPGPEAYWPELSGERGTGTIQGYYDQPESLTNDLRRYMAYDVPTDIAHHALVTARGRYPEADDRWIIEHAAYLIRRLESPLNQPEADHG